MKSYADAFLLPVYEYKLNDFRHVKVHHDKLLRLRKDYESDDIRKEFYHDISIRVNK